MSKFKIVVEAEQQKGGPQKKRSLVKNETPASRSNQEQGIDKSTKRHKGVEIQPIAVGVESRADACEETSI